MNAVRDLLTEMRLAVQAAADAQDETLAAHGVTAAERRLLGRLADARAALPLAEIACTLLTPVADAWPVLEALLRRGWVRRDAGDGQACAVLLTDAGRDAWARLFGGELALLGRLDAQLDAQAVQQTQRHLRQLRRALVRASAAARRAEPATR